MPVEWRSAQIEYLHLGTAPAPGPLARKLMAAWPWWAWVSLAALGLVPAVSMYGGAFDPTTLYLWPATGAVGFVASALPLCVVAGIRGAVRLGLAWRFRIAPGGLTPERRPVAITLAVLAAYWLVAGTPLAVNGGVAARRSALESIRTRVAGGTMPAGPVTVLPFRITDTERYTAAGADVVILYTDGTRGAFPGGGSGLIYLPAGKPFPGYNRGCDGHAFGRWHWFTTD